MVSNSPLSVKVDAIPGINFLKKANKQELSAVARAMKQVAFFMEGEVKESISGNRAEKKSVDTGRFRGTVKGTTDGKFVAKVESNVSYSKPLEYGTSKMQPRRHFRNSLTRNKAKAISYVQNEVDKVR